MNKLATLVLLLLGISFGTSQEQTITSLEIVKIEKPEIIKGFTIEDEDYTLHFDIEKAKDNTYSLMVAIELHDGSHYISPFAERDFKGKLYIDLGSYTHLGFKDNIIETPRSTEEVDTHPFVNGTVNWVRENTSYKLPLEIKSQENFEVFGRLRFTIEPRCTLEEIPFAISYKEGLLKTFPPKC